MYTRFLALSLFVLSFHRGYIVAGISCYQCVSATNHCILENGKTGDCDKKYCTIYRRDYLDPAGKIQHFYRSCENAPTYLNAVIRTHDHVAYYRACETNLCNIGNGIEQFEIDPASNSSTLLVHLVPGIGSASTALFPHQLIITFISLAFFLLRPMIG